jgi:hypothetical protein
MCRTQIGAKVQFSSTVRCGNRLKCWNGQMRKQVEVLEHHPDLAPHLVDGFEVVGQFHPVNDQTALLPVLDPVDAA